MVRRIVPWNAQQIGLYLGGSVIFSIGAKLFIDSKLGVDPLDTLTIGIAHRLHTTIGLASGLVAIFFLAWWMLWNRKRPPLTPFVTTFLVGNLIDLWNGVGLFDWLRLLTSPVVMMTIGLQLCAYASALIIMSGIGIRIMDLVALTFIAKLHWNFFASKMTLEIGMFTIGWLIGGPVGIATIAFLFLVGPFIQPFMFANERVFGIPNYGSDTARPRVGG